jgi:shikimate dehydrogenase
MTATIRAGVMGWPVAHSRSPALHGHWLQRYGIDGSYVAIPVKPEDLPVALRDLPRQGFAGVNLTVPHKEPAAGIVDRLDDDATRIGAVNTVIAESDGTLSGRNTDAYGFIENLRNGAAGDNSAARFDRPVVILGAGGAARAVVVALCDAGAGEIRIVNRTSGNAERLAALVTRCGGMPALFDWTRRAAALDGAGLLVNTTTLGMQGAPPLDLVLDALPADALVNDIVYAPLETPLLAAARARGNAVVDGLGMLLYQAQPAFEAWFGVRPEVDAALRAAVLVVSP